MLQNQAPQRIIEHAIVRPDLDKEETRVQALGYDVRKNLEPMFERGNVANDVIAELVERPLQHATHATTFIGLGMSALERRKQYVDRVVGMGTSAGTECLRPRARSPDTASAPVPPSTLRNFRRLAR